MKLLALAVLVCAMAVPSYGVMLGGRVYSSDGSKVVMNANVYLYTIKGFDQCIGSGHIVLHIPFDCLKSYMLQNTLSGPDGTYQFAGLDPTMYYVVAYCDTSCASKKDRGYFGDKIADVKAAGLALDMTLSVHSF